jgi:hypothetical protein
VIISDGNKVNNANKRLEHQQIKMPFFKIDGPEPYGWRDYWKRRMARKALMKRVRRCSLPDLYGPHGSLSP